MNLVYTLFSAAIFPCALFSCLLFGCTKEKGPLPQEPGECGTEFLTPPDTIYPGNYLPVYPGSYWIYVKTKFGPGGTSTGFDTMTTSPGYVLHSYLAFAPYGTDPDSTVPAYVPYWNNKPMYGYGTPMLVNYVPSLGSGMSLYYYLSESAGATSYSSTGNYGNAYTTVIAKDVPVTVGTTTFPQVIITEDYTYYYSELKLRAKHYYAKNVGLIKSELYPDPDWPQSVQDTTILEISSYLINQ
jgi:hypothetical protein